MRLEADMIVKAKRDEVKYAMLNFVLEDKLWLKVRENTEQDYDGLVYDLNIPNKHTYVLNGLVSSNSEDFIALHAMKCKKFYNFSLSISTIMALHVNSVAHFGHSFVHSSNSQSS